MFRSFEKMLTNLGPLLSDPPGTPNITGVTSESILEEGQVKRLTCISMAGNPLADLKWFRLANYLLFSPIQRQLEENS